jgi:hypothetical protein
VQTSLLLKSPHTFAIQYMTTGKKAHPYLNRFKECALTSCSVDYTPDGTYMTYDGDEKSMTAYRMTLSFSGNLSHSLMMNMVNPTTIM